MTLKATQTPLLARLLPGAAILVITLAAYLPSLKCGFVWDDNDIYITNNPLIKAPDGLRRFWFTLEPTDYYPLVSSAWWFQWRIFGLNAAGYHAVNVFLHAVCAVLLWRVFTKLQIPGALLAAMAWSAHPVNVETVTWISELKNILPMTFSLLSFLAYLEFQKAHRHRDYWLALGLFLLALLGKPGTAMFPFVLVGLIWWERRSLTAKGLLPTLPFFVLALLLSLVTILFQSEHVIGRTVVHSNSFAVRLAGAGYATFFYLYKALLPINLTFIYPRWEIDPYSIAGCLPVAILTGTFAVLWHYRQTWSAPLLAGLGFFVLNLLPVLGFFDIYFFRFSFVADHWQYISLAGLTPLGVWLTHRACKQLNVARPIMILAGVTVVGVLGILTWRQQAIYHNEESLWGDTLAKNPNAWIAHHNYSVVLMNAGKLEEAIRHCNEALRLQPGTAEVYNTRGNAYVDQGDYSRGMADYNQAIAIDPYLSNSYYNRGRVYLKTGDYDRAIRDFARAIEIDPTNANAYNNRAVTYFHLKDYDRAWVDVSVFRQLGGTPNPGFVKALAEAAGRTEQ